MKRNVSVIWGCVFFLFMGLSIQSLGSVILFIEGERVQATVKSIDKEGRLIYQSPTALKPTEISKIQTIYFEKEVSISKEDKENPIIYLQGHDWVKGKIINLDEKEVTILSPFAEKVNFPIQKVIGIIWSKTDDKEEWKEMVNERMTTFPREGDEVFIKKEDELFKLTARIKGIERGRLHIVWEDKPQSISLVKVYGILFSAKEIERPQPEVSVWLGDYGKLSGKKIEYLNEKGFYLTREENEILSLEPKKINKINFKLENVIFLSDLEPVEIKEMPFFDYIWHYKKDKSCMEKPIILSGEIYEKGLGVHSYCKLTYSLEGRYQRFLTTIGLDDGIEKKLGEVVFKVWADNKKIFERTWAKAKDKPELVNLDIRGVKRLTLEVDFGDNLDIGDQANWADARVTK